MEGEGEGGRGVGEWGSRRGRKTIQFHYKRHANMSQSVAPHNRYQTSMFKLSFEQEGWKEGSGGGM